jgi:hypothetical protein
MDKEIQDHIKSLRIKIVALGKAANECVRELEALSAKVSNPAPAVRRNLKDKRIQDHAEFYSKRGIKKK